MILVENSPKSDLDVPLQQRYRQQTDDSEYETTNEEEDYEDDGIKNPEEDRYISLPSLGLNNYLNNLNLNFHRNLNDRLNAFETSLWKFYENTQFPQFPPVSIPKPQRSLEAITNLFKQISEEDTEARLKRQEFQEVQKKASAELRRRLGPKLKSRILSSSEKSEDSFEEESDLIEGEHYEDSVEVQTDRQKSLIYRENIDTDVVASGDRNVPRLNEEFWSQFLGFKTETKDRIETAGGGDPSTQINLKPPINPFYNRVYLSNIEWIKCVILSVLCLIRIVGIFLCLTVAIMLAFIGSAGLTSEQMNASPFPKWRRAIRWIIANVVMRTMFFCAGFHWVKWIGKQASSKEAPVLVVAPHSSYFDAFAVPLLGGPSVVAKDEAKNIPFFGKLIDFTQPIYVKREERSSRSGCIKEIERRVHSDGEWQQVFIFPEGTCTNRSALAQFKIGPFTGGSPVQPVILRYPNRIDSPTWTFDGPSSLWSAWVSLSQFQTFLTVECLPVYIPNEAEQKDATLYARNVQKVMADALGIPVTNYSMEDGIVLSRFSRTHIRTKLKTIWKIKGDLNLREAPTETTLVYEGTTSEKYEWKIDESRFQEIFNIPKDSQPNLEVEALFNLFKPDDSNLIDMRGYLLFACFLYSEAKLDLLISIMFKMYTGENEKMSKDNFLAFMINVFEASEKEAIELFNAGSTEVSEIAFKDFNRKILHRAEFVKLFAMEETGQISGNFPRRHDRDQRPADFAKPKSD